MMRNALLVAGLIVPLLTGGADTDGANLYQARTLLTGQEEPNRSIGFGKCLDYVLVKVTGDPRLIDNPRIAAMTDRAATYVADFHYRDLMEGIPLHDEQGTRERPYELTVNFDPAKIDAAVRSLGAEPWTASRPRLVVFVAVRNGTAAYTLASDGSRGRDLRDALAAAADRLGMPMALPDEIALTKAGVTFDNAVDIDLTQLDAIAKAAGGDLAAVGRLDWSDGTLGWTADWRLASGGQVHRWQVSGVNFDDAFRSAMSGAAQILSGHGAPD